MDSIQITQVKGSKMIDEVLEAEESCEVCNDSVGSEDRFTTNDGAILCENHAMPCGNCDTILSTGNDNTYVDDEAWCSSCVRNEAYYCDSCESWGRGGTCYVTDRAQSWCEYCMDNNANYCGDCDTNYVDTCECDESSRLVHEYRYTPYPLEFHSINHDERLFFGVEIEMSFKNSMKDAAEYASVLEGLNFAYLKEDGSINGAGFELVTNPMSHDYYMNKAEKLWEVLEGLRSTYKARAWDASSCGMHIHISRAGFNGGAHMHRFLKLVYSNQVFYESLAGRNDSQWSKFDDVITTTRQATPDGSTWLRDARGAIIVKSQRDFTKKIKSRHGDRYSAVNTNNEDTLEMRIFRSSVNGGTIKSNLDLAHASVEYTRNMDVKKVMAGSLEADNFKQYILSNEELYPNLVRRMKLWALLPTVYEHV